MSELHNLDVYCEQLNAGIVEKSNAILKLIQKCGKSITHITRIVDFGCGTGLLICFLSQTLPKNIEWIGIDQSQGMIEKCEEMKKLLKIDNLRFICSNNIGDLQRNSVDVFIFSSVLHEIYSYGGDSTNKVQDCFTKAHNALNEGGCVFIRDFVKPLNASQKVILRHRNSDITQGHDFETFSSSFSRMGVNRCISLNYLICHPFCKSYGTDMGSAYEFIYRKDYHINWIPELNEKYGFFSQDDYFFLLNRCGFRVGFSEQVDNQFIIDNRLKHKVVLFDYYTQEKIDFPKYQIHIVATKQ